MIDEKLFDDVYSITLKKLIRINKKINENIISESITQSLNFLGIDNFKEFKKCAEDLLKAFEIKSKDSSTLSNNDNHENWYDPNKKRPYWDSHKEWLLEISKKPVDVVNEIDKSTDEILGLLENPTRKGLWDRRGLVVGNVQSGKTSNFTALINKAADAGYKFIIVMSGLTKDLRRQTHERLDEGFFGFNTEQFEYDNFSSSNILPLGKIRQDKLNRPNTYTSSAMNGDLSKAKLRAVVNTHTEDLTLLCVKKNKTSLENLIRFVLSSPNVPSNIVVKDKPFAIKQIKENSNEIDFKNLNENIDADDLSPDFPLIKDKPILLIDDEVDHASVDTGIGAIDENDQPNDEYDPKTINKLIRQLLNLYEKKSYIGYTATPFANVFIHPNEYTKDAGPGLFPKSFIHDLPEPNNYYGIEKLFSEETGDIDESFLEIVDDHCHNPQDIDCFEGWMPPKHYTDHEALTNGNNIHPNSLKRAILSFIASCSIRNLRGQIDNHKSMLIHVSKYIKVNQQIKVQVINTIDKIRSTLLNPGTDEFINFKKEIEEELNNFPKQNEFSFDQIFNSEVGIKFVVSEISLNIKNLSGDSVDFLNYEQYKRSKGKGLQTIIIGGDRLSRGITLEGLSTSYFLRSTKMYDTLMQMGRWFGYRQGYQDLCKLFTTPEMMDWFYFISEATEELKLQFRIMSEKNLTPQDFGLKVKSHPLLMITSRVKMQHGHSITSSFVDHFGQTTSFDLNKVDHNLKLVEIFLNEIEEPSENKSIIREYGNEQNSYVWKNVNSSKVINFLNKYEIHEDAKLVRPHFYSQYIKNLNSIDELKEWTVGLMGSGSSGIIEKVCNKYEVNLLKRKARKADFNNKYSIGALTNPLHQMLDLDNDQIKEIIKNSKDKKNYGAKARQLRNPKNGLLLIYPIEKPNHKNSKSKICFGFAISFPSKSKSKYDENNVSYKVNNVFFKQEYFSNQD
jgi:hypothetical protein